MQDPSKKLKKKWLYAEENGLVGFNPKQVEINGIRLARGRLIFGSNLYKPGPDSITEPNQKNAKRIIVLGFYVMLSEFSQPEDCTKFGGAAYHGHSFSFSVNKRFLEKLVSPEKAEQLMVDSEEGNVSMTEILQPFCHIAINKTGIKKIGKGMHGSKYGHFEIFRDANLEILIKAKSLTKRLKKKITFYKGQ